MKRMYFLGQVLLLTLLNVCLYLTTTTLAQEKPKDEPLRVEVSKEFLEKNQLSAYFEKAQKWDKDIDALRKANATDSDANAVLFLGSSSIRMWKSISEDIAPIKPIRRGYGGAKYCDLAIYTPALVRGLQFKAAAIFIGNDITGSQHDKTPEEVARLSRIVIQAVRSEVSDVPILLISVTATPSRFKHWPRIREVNRALENLARSERNVSFLETQSHYLNEKQEPKPEYFVKDMLHQNEAGYKVWGGLVRDRLESILR